MFRGKERRLGMCTRPRCIYPPAVLGDRKDSGDIVISSQRDEYASGIRDEAVEAEGSAAASGRINGWCPSHRQEPPDRQGAHARLNR